MTFRRRLALACAAAVAVAVALGSVVAYVVVRDTLRGQIDAALRDQIPRSVTFGTQAAPPPTTGGGVGLLVAPPVFTQLISREGDVIGKSGSTPLTPRSELAAVATGKRAPFFADRRVNGVHVRVYTARAAPGLAFQAARSLTEVDDALLKLRWALGALALGGVALAFVLARLATRAVVRPVTELTATAEHVASTNDLSRRIAAEGEDEVSRLAATFNSMLEALQRSQRAQRQLVADASHELRTPLTSLRTNLEVLARGDRLSEDDRGRIRADLVAQLEELTELVGDLVELARDEEPDAPAREDVRLDELVAAAVERARRHAPGVRFETELEPTIVEGVAPRLDRAVANLLDNAAKWSPPGGAVEVRLRRGELTVRDHGPGIAPADCPLVFDRFFRATEARGRPGSGLGLAIVRQVAEGHGGTVSAEAADGGGALLRMRLSANP